MVNLDLMGYMTKNLIGNISWWVPAIFGTCHTEYIIIMGQFIDTSGVYWQSWVKTFDFPFALGDEHPAAVVWGDMFREAKIDANLFLFV